MGWARFDDGFTDHPKVAAAGAWGELLAMRGVLYAAKHETDGFIPFGQLPRLGVGIPAVKKRAVGLVDAGLWEDTDGGWLIHDYLDYNPSRAEKEDERGKARERMRDVRANKTRTSRYPLPSPKKDEDKSSSSNGFVEFNAKRAVEAVRQRQKSGLKVISPNGLARTIAANDDHITESKRLWAHRDCKPCKGKGYTEDYAPGAGQVRIPCEEPA